MRFISIRLALLALLALCAPVTPAVPAASLTGFNAAVEVVSSHNRVALGYLRTGNDDLAMLEIERLRAAWATLINTYGKDRPDAFNPALYAQTLTDIGTKLVAADLMMRSGRPEATQTALVGIRDALSDMRRKSGVQVLADCVLDANAAMIALGDLDRQPLNWSEPDTASQLSTKTERYRQELQRCDAIAPAAIKESPEFRRLIDGALASLTLVPKAIDTRDSNLFHRIVIELQAFDNLLAFRFG
jgi:hypothetical protein